MKTFGFNFENTYTQLPRLFYDLVVPTTATQPEIVLFNEQLAGELNLDKALKQDGADMLSGNILLNEPFAQAYAGHQFGHFTMLGDGRAILLGEHQNYDVQLKGAGRTTYSRGGDGKATLSSMLREYIISEAMHVLNIPTTRSLSVVLTGDPVIREVVHKGAVLTRISKAHIRVGTFQYAAMKHQIKALADYTINRLYPESMTSENKYLHFLDSVITAQAELIAKWQSVGFIHGVMNTDNMSIAGETIDYGPCAFMDVYHPKTVFSSIDHQGRYAYQNQPYIALWNLTRFAETLLPLLNEDEKVSISLAENSLDQFMTYYHTAFLRLFSLKLGIKEPHPEDMHLINTLLDIMTDEQLDFTNTFVFLTHETYSGSDRMNEWYKLWQKRLSLGHISFEDAIQIMKVNNPYIIPRNHIVEEVLDAATINNLEPLKAFLSVLENPFDYSIPVKYTLPPKSGIPYKTYCGT